MITTNSKHVSTEHIILKAQRHLATIQHLKHVLAHARVDNKHKPKYELVGRVVERAKLLAVLPRQYPELQRAVANVLLTG